MKTLLLPAPLLRQIARYGFVGVISNLAGYLAYLVITWLWLDPRVAVTLLYPCGAILAYYGHARYTFQSGEGLFSRGLARYAIAHSIGYGTNIFILRFLHTQLGFPHQLVQALAIFMVAGVLFLLFKYFVFPARPQAN